MAYQENEFWSWFEDNKQKLEEFLDNHIEDYEIYHKLTTIIKHYHKDLRPELTKNKKGKYIMIITPGGLKEGVEPTLKLIKEKPFFKNWEIKAFRQPVEKIHLEINSISYSYKAIEILPESIEGEKIIDIRVFIPNLNNDEQSYKQLAFLYLDHIVGEYNVISKIRYIDFYHLDESQTVKESIDLPKLRNLIENQLN